MNITQKELHDGYGIVFEFENGFGLSVINHSFSYGLEAGLLKDGELVHDNDKFIDVIGNLTEKELIELISWTSSLPADYQVS